MAGENDMKCTDTLTVDVEVHRMLPGEIFAGTPIYENGKKKTFRNYQDAFKWVYKQDNPETIGVFEYYRKSIDSD